jgi:hypothetical protein
MANVKSELPVGDVRGEKNKLTNFTAGTNITQTHFTPWTYHAAKEDPKCHHSQLVE